MVLESLNDCIQNRLVLVRAVMLGALIQNPGYLGAECLSRHLIHPGSEYGSDRNALTFSGAQVSPGRQDLIALAVTACEGGCAVRRAGHPRGVSRARVWRHRPDNRN